MAATESSRELLDRYRDGESQAAAEIFQRYSNRLLALVQGRLSQRLSRRIDADDVVQSAYRSFFVQAREGEFQIENEGDLWRLMAAITLHKLKRQARRHGAAKRALEREAASGQGVGESLAQLAGREPAPDDALAAEEEMGWLFAHFESHQQAAFVLRWQGYTLAEIAARLSCSERTLRRWFADAQGLLAERLRSERNEAHEIDVGTKLPAYDSLATLAHGDYRLTKLIGAGGMCKVYEALEASSGKRVAVKVLRKRLRRRPHFIERFVKESQIVAGFSHPHIVPVHGLGRLPDGGYFMVMDFIDGSDLAVTMRSERKTPQFAANVVTIVADAVQYAHDRGVIHRDLKPANVLMDRSGQVFVTDFGFAWTEGEGGSLARAIVGTEGFIAPEQMNATAGPIGPHTDVFGLGALLYTMLEGVPPGPIDGHNDATHPARAQETDAAHQTLRTLCLKCLAPNWNERFATAQAVADALHKGSASVATRH